jgi:SAM-dependent methyltransferase
VAAFTRLGALSIGYDLEEGPRNPWVVWGNGSPIQFADNTFDIVWCNILDHIPDASRLFEEVYRVLRNNGEFYNIVDQNKPDKYSVRDMRGVSVINSLVEKSSRVGFINVSSEFLNPSPLSTFGTAYYLFASKRNMEK